MFEKYTVIIDHFCQSHILTKVVHLYSVLHLVSEDSQDVPVILDHVNEEVKQKHECKILK